jgi:hypothetical protein
VLICDGFGTHETLEILEFCLTNNITLCRLPSHTSHKLQPCDVGPFGPLKTAYRDQVERLNRGGIDTVGKEHFTSLYSPARDRALTCNHSVRCVRYITHAPLRRTSIVKEGALLYGPCGEDNADAETGNRL